jgi:hypothetical protein
MNNFTGPRLAPVPPYAVARHGQDEPLKGRSLQEEEGGSVHSPSFRSGA